MDWNAIIQIAVSVIIVGGGAAIIKIFISRAFQSIDRKLDEFFKWVNKLDSSLQDAEKDIIRIQAITKNIEKMETIVYKLDKNKLEKIDFTEEIEEVSGSLEKLVERIDHLYDRLIVKRKKPE